MKPVTESVDSMELQRLQSRAQEILDFWTKKRFTRKVFARFGNNREASVYDARAQKFCIVGVMQHLKIPVLDRVDLEKWMVQVLYGEKDGKGSIVAINDGDRDGHKKLRRALKTIRDWRPNDGAL